MNVDITNLQHHNPPKTIFENFEKMSEKFFFFFIQLRQLTPEHTVTSDYLVSIADVT